MRSQDSYYRIIRFQSPGGFGWPQWSVETKSWSSAGIDKSSTLKCQYIQFQSIRKAYHRLEKLALAPY